MKALVEKRNIGTYAKTALISKHLMNVMYYQKQNIRDMKDFYPVQMLLPRLCTVIFAVQYFFRICAVVFKA